MERMPLGSAGQHEAGSTCRESIGVCCCTLAAESMSQACMGILSVARAPWAGLPRRIDAGRAVRPGIRLQLALHPLGALWRRRRKLWRSRRRHRRLVLRAPIRLLKTIGFQVQLKQAMEGCKAGPPAQAGPRAVDDHTLLPAGRCASNTMAQLCGMHTSAPLACTPPLPHRWCSASRPRSAARWVTGPSQAMVPPRLVQHGA